MALTFDPLEDVAALARTPGVTGVSPMVWGNSEVESEGKLRRTTVYGVGANMTSVFKMAVRSGRFLPADDEAADAIGILTITPSEAAIIAADAATKAAPVEIGFLDRFSGSLVITGRVSDVKAAVTEILNTLNHILGFDIPKITYS